MTSQPTCRPPPLGRIPCDFPGCETTFTRQQDMNRHKQELHADKKHCPWCDYEARRDQRLLAHIDLCHRPKKHRSSGDLSPRDQYEDLQIEDTMPPEVEVTKTESSVQGTNVEIGQGFEYGVSGERLLSQKDSCDHSSILNQFVQPFGSSQSSGAGNQAILKQAYPAASPSSSGPHHSLKRRSHEMALRTTLSKGPRNLIAKSDFTSRDNWQKVNHTTSNQTLTSVNQAADHFDFTSFNQMQGYHEIPSDVPVPPKKPSSTFFSFNHTQFDEPVTVPYLSSQQSPSFQSTMQNHTHARIIPSITHYGQNQLPLQPSFAPPSANTQSPQPPTTSFVSPLFYDTPDEPPCNI